MNTYIEGKLASDQARSDQEFLTRHNELQTNIDSLTKNLASMSDRKSPDFLKGQQALQDAVQARNDHWHPAKNPGKLQKFGHILAKAVHLPQAPAPTPVNAPVIGQPTLEANGETIPTGPAFKVQGQQTPSQVEAAKETGQAVAALPPSPEQQATQEQSLQAMKDMGAVRSKMTQLNTLFPQATNEQKKGWFNELAASITGVKVVPEKYFTQLATTKDADGKEHYWRVPMMPDESPEEVDFNGQTIVPKGSAAGGKPVRGWTRDKKGKIFSILLDPKTNQKVPGSDNYDILPPAYMTTRISSGVFHWVDENNAVHEIPESRTTYPAFQAPGGGGAPAAPPTAPGGQAPGGTPSAASAPPVKRTTPPPQPGTPQSKKEIKDRILGYKGSSVLNHARGLASDAHREALLADRLAARARAYPNDMAEADTQFVLGLIRSEAGRVNQQEIAMLFSAGGIEEGPQRWLAKVGHGQLSPRLRQQLIDFAHDTEVSASQAAKDLEHGGQQDTSPEALNNQGNKQTFPGAPDIGAVWTDTDTQKSYRYLGGDPLQESSYQEVTQ